ARAMHPFDGLASARHVADEVGLDHIAPCVLVHFVERLGAESRAADQHVDAAETLVDRGKDGLDVLAPAGVRRQAAGLAAAVARVGEGVLELLRVAAEGQDARAFIGQHFDGGPSYTGRSTGYENALAA